MEDNPPFINTGIKISKNFFLPKKYAVGQIRVPGRKKFKNEIDKSVRFVYTMISGIKI